MDENVSELFDNERSVLTKEAVSKIKKTIEWIYSLRSPSLITQLDDAKELAQTCIDALRFVILGFCFSDVGPGCIQRIVLYKPCYSVKKMQVRCMKMHIVSRIVKNCLDLTAEKETIEFTNVDLTSQPIRIFTSSMYPEHKEKILESFDKYCKISERSTNTDLFNSLSISAKLEFFIQSMLLLVTIAWMSHKMKYLSNVIKCDPNDENSVFKVMDPERALYQWGSFCGEFFSHGFWSSTLIQAGSTESVISLINDISQRLQN